MIIFSCIKVYLRLLYASSINKLRDVYSTFVELCDSGFTKPTAWWQFNDMIIITQSLCLHHDILKGNAKIDRLARVWNPLVL